MLDGHRLRLLRELSYRGTISAVAEALGYTASAISQQLAVLEREAGTPLLERVGRGVRLTDAAQRLVVHAEEVLAELERAEGTLARARTGLTGRLRIGAFRSAAQTLVPPVLVTLGLAHPELQLTVGEFDPLNATGSLRAGELDVALTQDYDLVPVPTHAALSSTVLLEEPMVLASCETANTSDSVGDLRDSPWIMGSPGTMCRLAAERICHAAGFQPQIRHQTDDFPTALALIQAGLGAALMPTLGARSAPPDVVLTQLTSTSRLSITHRRGAGTHPAIAAFRSALEESVSRYAETPLGRRR